MAKPGASMGYVFIALEKWLSARFSEWLPEIVVFESPRLVGRGSVNIERRLFGMAAIAELVALKHGYRVFEVETATVTKNFIGRGGRFPGGREEKKRLVIEQCRKYSWNPQDDNAADSLAILTYAQSLLDRGEVNRTAGPLFR